MKLGLTTALLAATALMLGFGQCGLPAQAAELTPALSAADMDLANTLAFDNGVVLSGIAPDDVAIMLGTRGWTWTDPGWNAVCGPNHAVQFRVCFSRPVAIGSLITEFDGPIMLPTGKLTGQFVSYLKPTAPYPGNVDDDSQWAMLAPGPVKTFPVGAMVRSLRFTNVEGYRDRHPHGVAIGGVAAFRERLFDATSLGVARTYDGDGTQEWLGVWRSPIAILALAFVPTVRARVSVEALGAGASLPANIAPDDQFAALPDVASAPGYVRVSAFAQPVVTSGLKLTMPLRDTRSGFQDVVPLVDLHDRSIGPESEAQPPPFEVPFAMPIDGYSAVAIFDKSTGRIVRHLSAEVHHDRGSIVDRWDLKDDDGNYVAPGDYGVKGIARPPFKLTYELGAYSAGQPPWFAPPPAKGGGGWLADHTPPMSIRAMAGAIWVGSPVGESGNSEVALDLDGNKLWGKRAIDGFEGPERIATDGKVGLLVNSSFIQQVDPAAGFAARNIYEFGNDLAYPIYDRDAWPGDKGGAAAFGGKLCISYWLPDASWLAPSFSSDDMDLVHSIPAFVGRGRHSNKRDPNYREGEYDTPQRDYAAFLTGRTPDAGRQTPSDLKTPSSVQAYFGDAPQSGPYAGNLVMACNKPIVVGSVLVPDASTQVWALKPGRPLPAVGASDASPLNEDDWLRLSSPPQESAGAPGIALAPVGALTTTALRFKANRLTFALVLGHRLANVAPAAQVVYGEGGGTRKVQWSVVRPSDGKPIDDENPAAMALVWSKPVALRGISLTFPGLSTYVVQTYSGSGDPKSDISNDAAWSDGPTLEPPKNWMKGTERPTIESADLDGQPVLAVRIKVVDSEGGVAGRPYTASIASIIAYESAGGDSQDVPAPMTQRIDEYALPAAGPDTGMATLLRRIPISTPGDLTFDAHGTLYAISGGAVVTVPLDSQDPRPVTVVKPSLLVDPTDLAIGADGDIYVCDAGPNAKDIKVFDSRGSLLRTLGHPGGIQVGKWDPLRFDDPTGITIDRNGSLWIVDRSNQPKRIVKMTTLGVVEQEFLGPTQYGGGGWLDPEDRNALYYNGMKFAIDWPSHTWKLDSIVYRSPGGLKPFDDMPARPVYLGGREYLVHDIGQTPVSTIYLLKAGIAVPVAAMGTLSDWHALEKYPDLAKAFAADDASQTLFVWSDANGDGIPQASEVQTVRREKKLRFESIVGEDLAFAAPGERLKVKSIQPNGVPAYDIGQLEDLPLTAIRGNEQRLWETADGRIFVIGDRLVSADGKSILWQYTDKFAIHDGYYHSGYGYNRPAGVLNAEHYPVGHFKLGTEEYFVTNSDQGDWFVFTGDGMLAGCIFGGPRGYGLRQWSMPDWTPGEVDLSDVRLGQEHYHGCVVKADDGHVYAVAGFTYAGIVRVDGLEQLARFRPPDAVVKASDIDAAAAWAAQSAAGNGSAAELKAARLTLVSTPINIDGSLAAWPDDLFAPIEEDTEQALGEPPHDVVHAEGALCYDANNLYIAVRSDDRTPNLNSARDLTTAFKGGDAADITLGTDAAADPKRVNPVAGDVRIVLAKVNGNNAAVVYKPVDPQRQGLPVHFASPIGDTAIDTVRVLGGVQVWIGRDANWRSVTEAAIPWSAIGCKPPALGSKLRGDVGILQSDDNGTATIGRQYWSGKSQTMISDLSWEAKLQPALWGDFYCVPAQSQASQGR